MLRSSARDTDAAAQHYSFTDTATSELHTLSLHDALPISCRALVRKAQQSLAEIVWPRSVGGQLGSTQYSAPDRKSTRLNSSHLGTSYAVFCLKKKKCS